MHDEKKLIRLAMITLFLSLMIVYTLLYQVKGDKLKDSPIREVVSGGISIVPKGGTISAAQKTTGNTSYSGNTSYGNTNKTIYSSGSNTGIDTNPTKQNTTIKTLSGTSIYYGKSAIIDKLGIKYLYSLKDTKGIYYFNLGSPTYDFNYIAKSLGGNTFTLITEQDIFQNKLFGNKIIFVNLPENKDKIVLMVIYIKGEVWMIQIGYDIYHKSKDYLKSLFID